MRQERSADKTQKADKTQRKDTAPVKKTASAPAKQPEKQPVKQPAKQTAPEKPANCPYRKKCGGCQYSEIPYPEQLRMKERKVRRLLEGFGEVKPITGADDPFHYRNKVTASFGFRNGKMISGVYEQKTHRIVNIDGERVTLRGDGNLSEEHCMVGDIRAVAVGFLRKGRQKPDMTSGRKWRAYSWLWTRLLPIRRWLLFAMHPHIPHFLKREQSIKK